MKKRIKHLLRWAIALFVIHVMVIILFGVMSKAEQSDLIVVLGSKVHENGEPAKRLKYRLDKGAELFQQGMANAIIVSGGIGKEGHDEAAVMAAYLIQKGIPPTAIIQDNQGLTTYASAQNCRDIMQAQQAKSIIIVSQYFHLLRSSIAFKRIGIAQVSVESADLFVEWRDVYSVPREILGLYYYLVRSYDLD